MARYSYTSIGEDRRTPRQSGTCKDATDPGFQSGPLPEPDRIPFSVPFEYPYPSQSSPGSIGTGSSGLESVTASRFDKKAFETNDGSSYGWSIGLTEFRLERWSGSAPDPEL
jgi:hypothetical protein